MTRIRRVEINNFRGIQHLDWNPSEGINCLIGPGDSGKSTILDAIDICLGARRNVVFYDTDFHNLDVGQPLVISITLGDLPDALKNIESYGIFLRGYDNFTDTVEDEPEAFMETALTLRLTVSDDLEPSWTLFSERALTEGFERNLAWKDRLAIAPARIGHYTNSHLSWARGSILNRLTEERAGFAPVLPDTESPLG
ncbi:ATP-dependent nuclease [Castellaniella sp.]|uniref:ATP-dependent nuclease n=1 Tax=Castellaniella sp. TaxID=1955812 RepID=UPI002B00269B|nr:AAA family ATPase [Castellaniella sp.]